MKVLVATSESQGSEEGDYNWTVDGELVYVQDLVCASPGCGCDRGFAGMASSRSTTTAQVVDLPDFTTTDLSSAVHDSLERDGWLTGTSADQDLIDGILVSLDFLTGPAEPGTVVRRQAFADRDQFTFLRIDE